MAGGMAPDDLAACRAMIRTGSRSFFVASKLLPVSVRDAAYALYAFCRVSDDLIDLDGGRRAGIEELSGRLERAYAGRPDPRPVDRAFASVVETYQIPKALPAALLEGLSWDTEGRVYDTIDGLQAYAARVASSVGAMMSILMGVRGPRAIARACDLGVAMQLTNIARDVGEDARAGRIYLPRDWLRETGLDPDAWLAAPVMRPEIAFCVERLLSHAATQYRRGEAGIALLPGPCRPGIRAAARIYAEIGAKVAANAYDSVSQRAFVSFPRKLQLVASSRIPALGDDPLASAPVLPATRFLVDAVQTFKPSASVEVEGTIGWVLDLFAKIDERKRDLARGV